MTQTAQIQPWWERLPADFHRRWRPPRMPKNQRLQIAVTAAADRVVRTGLGVLMSSGMARSFWSSAQAGEELALLRFYEPFADRGDAAAVFPRPGPVTVRRGPARSHPLKTRGIPRERLRFAGGYRPLCPDVDKSYTRHRRNGIAAAEHWTHPDGPRPTLIFMHGYFLSGYPVNSWGFSLPWFYKKGYDIVLYTLPFHGARRAWHECYSGQGYFTGGLAGVNEAMRHAVHDVRALIDYLLARGAPSVGVSGLSLGGYLSALLAAVEPRLAFVIPNSPVVTPIDMALDWQPTGALLRWIMRRHGITLQELRHGTALHSPLTYKPVVDPDRLMIIGGAGDRFTPPRFVRLLHEHWPGSRLHWFPGNHILHLQQSEYLKLMRRFMDRHTGSVPAGSQ